MSTPDGDGARDPGAEDKDDAQDAAGADKAPAADTNGVAATKDSKTSKDSKKKSKGKDEKQGIFARFALFLRQVVAELRKVIWPTRSELINYTTVVLIFVVVMALILAVYDFAFARAVFFVFGD